MDAKKQEQLREVEAFMAYLEQYAPMLLRPGLTGATARRRLHHLTRRLLGLDRQLASELEAKFPLKNLASIISPELTFWPAEARQVITATDRPAGWIPADTVTARHYLNTCRLLAEHARELLRYERLAYSTTQFTATHIPHRPEDTQPRR